MIMSSVKEICKQTQRRDNWDDGEVRHLLEVWGDDRVQADLEGNGRNITIYRRIADRLNRGLGEGRSERTAVCRILPFQNKAFAAELQKMQRQQLVSAF